MNPYKICRRDTFLKRDGDKDIRSNAILVYHTDEFKRETYTLFCTIKNYGYIMGAITSESNIPFGC